MKKNAFVTEFRAKCSYIDVENSILSYFFDNFYSKKYSLEKNLDICKDYILSQDLEDEIVE